jgi:Na+/H+-dicarboxylate symporter/ABC-type amino acid transport substrate-binding protein
MGEPVKSDKTGKKSRFGIQAPGLSGWILISIILGLATGLFFGEIAGKIKIVGNIYIQLVQMTVIPYIVVSLIAGIGGLSIRDAGLMVRKGGVWLGVIWAMGFLVILLMPLAFPKWITASFFSTSLVAAPENFDFLSFYIPSNPFHSLSEGLIPAIILFCLALGIALMRIDGKGAIIRTCQTLSKTMVVVSKFMVKISPIGLFAITAEAAGTLTPTDFERLHVYIISFIVVSLILSLWILPALVSAFTPFGYKAVMSRFRAPFLVAFTTGNLFIVLPILVDGCKEMFREYQKEDEIVDNYVDVLIPVYFNFPNLGKLLILLFIPFSFWVNGSSLPLASYPSFIFSGLFSFFGGLNTAIPFLLDLFRLPAELYNLYIVTGVVTGRFANLLGAVNLVVFTLLTIASMTGLLKVKRVKLLAYVGVSIGGLAATVMGLALFMNKTLENPYNQGHVLSTRELYFEPVPSVVRDERPENPPRRRFEKNLLDEILDRGVLRVGYTKNNLPWNYRNNSDELVGLDVDLAHLLARDLGVTLEFVPFERDMLNTDIQQQRFDIAMSSILFESFVESNMNYTDPYMEISMAFVVPDQMRNDFANVEKINALGTLNIGLVAEQDDLELIIARFPKIVWTELGDYSNYFEGDRSDLDGVLISAEAGSSWTLLHPEFNVSVVVPLPVRYPMSFVTTIEDLEFNTSLNRWISIIKLNGKFETLYGYWVLGIDKPEDVTPRWSVVRDVLGWIE